MKLLIIKLKLLRFYVAVFPYETMHAYDANELAGVLHVSQQLCGFVQELGSIGCSERGEREDRV